MNSAIANKNRSAAVTAKVKRLVVQRYGDNGVRLLSRALGSGALGKDNFSTAVKELVDTTLSADDINAVWAEYDRKGSGSIDTADFVMSLRRLDPYRATLVDRAWNLVFTKTPYGNVDLQELHRHFCADGHPAVVRGDRTAQSVVEAFLDAFNERSNPDGTVSRSDFDEYYSAVSAAYDEVELFAALVRGTWNLPGCDAYFTSTLALTATLKERSFAAIQPIQVKKSISEVMKARDDLSRVIAAHRSSVAAVERGRGFRNVGHQLRAKDIAGTQYLSREDFLEALWSCRLYFEDKKLLQLLDTNNDNTVDVALYLNYLQPEWQPARVVMLERLWSKFSTDSKNRADIGELHKRFQAKDGNALNAFLAGWDKRLAMTVNGGRVSFHELLEWYAPISIETQMDAAFEAVLASEWK